MSAAQVPDGARLQSTRNDCVPQRVTTLSPISFESGR